MEYQQIEGHFSFGAEDQASTKNVPIHYHSLGEIYYLIKGTCHFYVDNHLYSMQSGDIMIVRGDASHKIIHETKPHSHMMVHFDTACISKAVMDLFPETTLVTKIPRIQKLLENLFQKIRGEHEHPDAFSQDYLSCYVAELLLLLARTRGGKPKGSAENHFVAQAIEYVHQNYMNKIALVEVAKFCAVSAEHLSRSFRKQTGFGFSEYLTLYRLRCAQEMLFYYPELSISEIAYKCGFNDGNYFSVVYKRWSGVSPSKLNRFNGGEIHTEN